MSIQKSTPQVVIDRQRLKVTFDGEELPFFYAEAGPRSAPYEEGLSVVWLPILVESVEDLPADDTRRCYPGLWRPTCGHSGGQGIGSGHVCECNAAAGHEPILGVGHGCSCGALWGDS